MSLEDEVVVSDIEVAGRMLTECIARDLRFASCDLQDALDAARYSSTPYTSPPKEWPPIVDVINARELPPVLIERYNAAGGQGTALCGIFPEIRRAWATVDNTLFLWRFDKWDGQCPEYSGEEQAICAVGLARAKPGVFMEAIQRVIVLATPVEIVLLGVCCSGNGFGGNPCAEISLQPLPEYTIPTDGVTMTCITATEKGRIFLGGRDGHLYELLYTKGTGWQSRCRKVCHTGGLSNLLSRWVVPNALKFGAVDAVIEITVDEERNILYTRTQESKIQVFDLGKNGDAAPTKVAEEGCIGEQRGDSRSSRSGGGSRVASRATTKTTLISIAPLSTVQSKWLHLVAIASDGRRIFLSTSPSTGVGSITAGNNTPAGGQRPSMLRVVMTRAAPSVGVNGGVHHPFGNLGRLQSESGLTIKCEAAHYSSGALILSDASPPTASRMLVTTRDLTDLSPSGPPGNHLSVGTQSARALCALREMLTMVGVGGRTLAIADVLPPPEQAAAVEFSASEPGASLPLTTATQQLSEETRARRLWARGELATQHMLPQRRAVVLSTMGLTEIVFNRPVDILQRLLELLAPRSVLEDFFQHYGAGEAAAMCLLLAARLTSDDENVVLTAVAERAAEAFEDPRLVGVPQMQGGPAAAASVINANGGGFNMGQVVQEAEPVFSGAHEGLCLCTARLLQSVWELPVMDVKDSAAGDNKGDGGVIVCRLPVEAMQALEDKIRSLEQFFRARRNQRRGHYARIFGMGDATGHGSDWHGSPFGADLSPAEHGKSGMGGGFETPQVHKTRDYQGSGAPSSLPKRQRVPYSPSELAAMEVRGMECIRRLLRRSAEALRLLQVLQYHHITRLAQSLDQAQCNQLVHLTFQQLVSSSEGEQLATRLVAALMEYHVAPNGRGTVDDISMKLREGCPSYYNESDYKFYQAVECLERAASTSDFEERERLAREALELLNKVPETADLLSVCKRFEDIRFYEAVVELPLRKARAVDPAEDAFNKSVGEGQQMAALAARRQCYDVVINALRSLKGHQSATENGGHGSKVPFSTTPSVPGARLLLDEAARGSYIRQIVQLGVRWPDTAFHEYLYQTMMELGLLQELLELGGPDLVPFLQRAGNYQTTKASQVANNTLRSPKLSSTPDGSHMRQPISGEESQYLELLAQLYVYRRQHALAAHVLLRLAERRQIDGAPEIALEQRYDYLSKAVLQARSSSQAPGGLSLSSPDLSDSGLLELLEAKLAVVRFQLKIQGILNQIAAKIPSAAPKDASANGLQTSMEDERFKGPEASSSEDAWSLVAKEKARELRTELKSITQLYNDYAVKFELWEVCLEILHFSNYTGDAENSVMRETWARVLDQALAAGGVAEACAVVRRLGPQFYPSDGGSMPIHTICLQLEIAAHDRMMAGMEVVGDEDVPRSLLAACKGAAEPVQRNYDRVLASGAILPKPSLRLRILRSVLTVMREWVMSTLSQRMGTSMAGGGPLLFGQQTDQNLSNQGMRDKLATTANRYTTDVKRLALPPADVEPVSRGFQELEETLQGL